MRDLLKEAFELRLLGGFRSRFGRPLLKALQDGQELRSGRIGGS